MAMSHSSSTIKIRCPCKSGMGSLLADDHPTLFQRKDDRAGQTLWREVQFRVAIKLVGACLFDQLRPKARLRRGLNLRSVLLLPLQPDATILIVVLDLP